MTDAELWSSVTFVYLCHANLCRGVECTAHGYDVTSVTFPVAFLAYA
jgi:hypothetical protein